MYDKERVQHPQKPFYYHFNKDNGHTPEGPTAIILRSQRINEKNKEARSCLIRTNFYRS